MRIIAWFRAYLQGRRLKRRLRELAIERERFDDGLPRSFQNKDGSTYWID